jgi:hypothetical protein
MEAEQLHLVFLAFAFPRLASSGGGGGGGSGGCGVGVGVLHHDKDARGLSLPISSITRELSVQWRLAMDK